MMRAPRLNLDYQRRRLPVPGLLLLGLGVVLAGAALLAYQEERDELAGLQARLASLSAGRKASEKAARAAVGAAAAAAGQAALQELNIPWDRLFKALEHDKPEQVTLLAIEPNARNGTARTVAEAASLDEMLAYSRRLKAEPALRDAYVADHEIEAGGDGRVRFTLLFSWDRSR